MDIYDVIAYTLLFAEIIVFAVIKMQIMSDNQYIETASKMLEDYSDAESTREKI